MSQEPQTGLTQFQELPAIAATAGAVLTKNTSWTNSAKAKGNTFLDTIEGEGMTQALFDDVVQFLVKVGEVKGTMNTNRAPITQLFTAIAKEYTTLENEMDKTKEGTVMYKLQIACNNFIKEQQIEQQRRDQEIRRQAMAKQERIDLTASIEQTVRTKYLDILVAFKKKASDLFNSLTLENADTVDAELKKIAEVYPENKFLEISVPITSAYMEPADLAGLIFDTRKGLYTELSANFKETMQQVKMLLIDQVPARKAELADIAKASAKEKKDLEKAAKIRRQQQELQAQQEALDMAKQQESAIELNKDIAQAELSFEVDVQQAEVKAENTNKSKESYVIKVMSAVGYQQIAALWFKEFAGKTTLDKLEKKTLGSMKGDLEKLAYNGGERLNDSGHLVYETDYKAVIKK